MAALIDCGNLILDLPDRRRSHDRVCLVCRLQLCAGGALHQRPLCGHRRVLLGSLPRGGPENDYDRCYQRDDIEA